MSTTDAQSGPRPPQQARSRETLSRILAAAEAELVARGADEVTIGAVARRAGVSVGAVYRRFEGKEQLLRAIKDRLLDRLESELATTLTSTLSDLAEVVEVFTGTVADWMVEVGPVLPELVGVRDPSDAESRAGLPTLLELFAAAAAPHRDQVRRHDPAAALAFIARTISASAMHRALTVQTIDDGMSWEAWRAETVDMATTYLTTDAPSGQGPCSVWPESALARDHARSIC